MSTSDIIQQIFEDAAFVIVNAIDYSKRLVLNLSGAVANKTMTLVSSHTDDRVIRFPDKSGTLETIEADREDLFLDTIDYSKSDIRVLNMTHSFTLGITNPIQGKASLLIVTPNNFNITLPAACKIVSGRFKATTVNYIYFHCIKDAPAEYIVTIGQQIA
jgi:hypothetical protein